MMRSLIYYSIGLRLLNTTDVDGLMSLSHRTNNINGNTLVLERARDITYRRLEEYRNTETCYLLAVGK